MSRLESLLKELPTRTAHLYRSIWHRYTQWLETIPEVDTSDVKLTLSQKWVIKYIISHGDLANDPLPTCDAMIWFARALGLEDSEVLELQQWLHGLVKLLEFDYSNVNGFLEKISINLWNPNTDSLQSKHFKTCQDKLKLLLDFQWKFSTNISFEDRTTVSLRDLRCVMDSENGKCGLAHPRNPSFVLIPNFQSPFTCPVFTMAVYYYLRFHGVKKYYKGDGYQIIFSQFEHVPIIRGKSLDQYPRELTLGNWYPTIFKYCQLPYTKKNWFQVNPGWPQFPNSTDRQSVDSALEGHLAESDSLNTIGVPDFYIERLNRTKFEPCPQVQIRLFPTDLPSDVQPIFDLLNSVLVFNLPLLYRVFPTHDIFLDPSLKTPQNLGFITGTLPLDIKLQEHLLAQIIDKNGAVAELVPGMIKTDHNEYAVAPLGTTFEAGESQVAFEEVRSELGKLIRLQTSTAFSQLITVLLEIFQRLDFKRSNKQFVLELLQSCRTDVKHGIMNANSVVPDSAAQNSADENSDDEGVNHRGKKGPYDAIAYNSDEDSESEYEPSMKRSKPNYVEEPLSEDENMEELAQMVNQLITRKFNENLEQQTDRIISSIQPTLREMVRAEVAEALNTCVRDATPISSANKKSCDENYQNSSPLEYSFEMSEDCSNIQSIILEWFTPNPECVHSMNKKYGNKWRLSDPNRKLYKQRKPIVQYYIHLINTEKLDKFDAFNKLESILERYQSIEDLSSFLDSSKKTGYVSVT
ncbi:unnamed protein product [Kluyveromyces dobzhanskii CBS 2104]|uniref:WGS project CCBQ000000000 data, contig 00106 n=1 Tax=Kluyveromyces dobzhanskii CBS 2104 TaxID=1427455 RepID=A0A0A8L5H3_9SACH|nr:unnamed protein product [Kluyveromyces dobzhanskii CBS 2104]